MKLSFPAPSSRVPVGGIAIIYEFAMALADRGHDVTILHHELFGGDAASSLDDIGWFAFRDNVSHVFVTDRQADLTKMPDADVFFGHSLEVAATPRLGLPVKPVQGWRMYPEAEELAAFRVPCPKVCIAQWLVDIGEELGIPRNELIHVPLGLDHELFGVLTPAERRPPLVTFCHNRHPRKGSKLALAVLEEVHRQRPEVAFAAFGTERPGHPVPEWLRFTETPDPSELVDEIYNGTAVFLCTSEVEGFGLTSLEAMACGAALVTTDNGGSRDYAIHERTALVSPPGERAPLVDHVLRLLDDDAERVRLAHAGADHASGFTWSHSAELLERFFVRYVAEPAAFGLR